MMLTYDQMLSPTSAATATAETEATTLCLTSFFLAT
jgi:hypothetical protein